MTISVTGHYEAINNNNKTYKFGVFISYHYIIIIVYWTHRKYSLLMNLT